MRQAMAKSPHPAQMEALISDEEFAKFCEFFYRKTGIIFDTKKKYFVERRIGDRMNAAGCTTFREYFSTLRFEASGAEMLARRAAFGPNEPNARTPPSCLPQPPQAVPSDRGDQARRRQSS